MNFYKSYKLILSLVLSIAIVLSGIIVVDYPSQNRHFLQLNKVDAATEYTTLKKSSDGSTIQIPIQIYTADTNGDGIGDTPYKYIEITESGTWTPPTAKVVDIFAVGAGGSGGDAYYNVMGGSGGGGGYATTKTNVTITANVPISIEIGKGVQGQAGGATSVGSYVTANGGERGQDGKVGSGGPSEIPPYILGGGNGGSGGGYAAHSGSITNNVSYGGVTGNGGSNGGDGNIPCYDCHKNVGKNLFLFIIKGKGQGISTADFLGRIHAAGGGAGQSVNGVSSAGIGGGGFVISNAASNGETKNFPGGTGGKGYGGGGGGAGAAGMYTNALSAYGGKGADGFVMVRWVANQNPLITTLSPSLNTIFSTPQPTMTLSGTIYDSDVGNSETIYYRVDGSAGQTGTAAATLTANGSNQSFSKSITVGTLTEGTHNIYSWVADNYGGKSAESCVSFKVDKTAPTANVPTLTVSSSSQITIQPNAADPVVSSVSAGLHSTPYMYYLNTTALSAWQAGNFTHTGLTPNTQYTYKYTARDSVLNTSAYSATASRYTLAATPIIAVSGVKSYTMDLSISDANPTSTPYQIMVGSNYVTSSGTLSSTAQWITLTSKTITVTGLSANATYTVKAKARNAESVETSYSSSVSSTTLVAPPVTPTGLVATAITTTSINAVWNVVSGATSYDIAVDGNTTNPQNVTTNSYNISGFLAGTSHTISIRAKNGGNPATSSWSTAITAWTLPAVPTGFTATPASNSISLSWNTVTSSAGNAATGYDISIDNGTSIISNGTATTYNHTALTPNSLHSYQVRAKNIGGSGTYSNAVSIYTLSNLPNNGSVSTITNTSMLASWQKDGNPEGTQYLLAAFDGNDIFIKQNAWTTNASDTLTGLTPDSIYKIKVKARNTAGIETDWYTISDSSKTLPNAPSIPTGVTATTNSNSSINITWNAQNAATYDVTRDGVLVAQNLTAASYTDIGLTPETTYKYSVQAKNTGGNSGFSTEISQSTLPNVPTAPTGVNFTATTDSITLTWNSVEKATGYKIDNGISQIDIGKVTSYMTSALNKNTQYSFKIIPYNEGGDCDSESNCTYTICTLIDTPAEVTAASSSNRILISWTSVAEATYYEVDLNVSVKYSPHSNRIKTMR